MRTIETPATQDKINVTSVPRGNMPVIWNRGGRRAVVPTAIIINARATHQAGETLLNAGLIESIPELWSEIWWESCRPLDKPLPVLVKDVNLNPRPGVVKE